MQGFEIEARSREVIPLTKEEVGLSEEELRELPWARAGIAEVHQTRIGYELVLGAYVGRLVIPGAGTVDVKESYTGTVAACLDLTATGRRGEFQRSSIGTVHVEPWKALLKLFAETVRDCLAAGHDRRYLVHPIVTSYPRGKVDAATTVRKLQSRGRTDVIACRPRRLTEDTPINRLLLSACVRAEGLARREQLEEELLQLRQSTFLLGGARLEPWPDIDAALRSVLPGDDLTRRTAGLAELLIRGVPALPLDDQLMARYDVSAWLDAEKLFEEAIRTVIERLCPPGTVRRGQGDGVRLFTRHPGDPSDWNKSADPDIVIDLPRRTLILDAKYRRHRRDFNEDELYQLMAHATAYSASDAALISASDESGTKWLGRDRNGIAYHLVLLDAGNARSMLATLTAWLAGVL